MPNCHEIHSHCHPVTVILVIALLSIIVSLIHLSTSILFQYIGIRLQSYCHTVILSYCHTAILSYCHTVILSYCHIDFLNFINVMPPGTTLPPLGVNFS